MVPTIKAVPWYEERPLFVDDMGVMALLPAVVDASDGSFAITHDRDAIVFSDIARLQLQADRDILLVKECDFQWLTRQPFTRGWILL